MKKILLSLVVCSATMFAAKAQVSFGIKGGIGVYNLSGDDIQNTDSKVGVVAGAYAAIPVFGQFSVTPEVQFAGQGAKQTESGVTAKYLLDYVNIPVMFQYRNASGFFAETGPQIGFRASAKVKAAGQTEDFKDQIKSTAFSWGVGAGYRSSVGVGVNARYVLSLNSIAEDQGGQSYDVKNSGFQVGLFFEFGGAKKK